jgi:hypothetical protein
VQHCRSISHWTRLTVLTLTASGSLLFADDQPATTSDGYKIIKSGGMPIRVKDQPDALAHANLTDELDHQRAFSASNPMGSKSYAFTADSMAQSGSDYSKKSDATTFITRPYSFNANSPTAPNLNSKAELASANSLARPATGFNKGYATSTADSGQNQAASFSSQTASEQNRAAVLGAHDVTTPASAFSGKTFEGDEAVAAKRHLSRGKNGQIIIDDLPSRPLTIDEVRDLIDHGFKADTDEKPAEDQSKPLNDPSFQPKPLRDESPAGDDKPVSPASVDDKDDPVPSPGMMSTTLQPPPENTQPLPQK